MGSEGIITEIELTKFNQIIGGNFKDVVSNSTK